MYLSSRTNAAILAVMQEQDTARVVIKNELDRLNGPIDDFWQVLLITAGIKLGLDDGCFERLRLATFVMSTKDPRHVDCRLRTVATAFALLKKSSPSLTPDPCVDTQQQIIRAAECLYQRQFPSAHLPFPTSVHQLLTPLMSVRNFERMSDIN